MGPVLQQYSGNAEQAAAVGLHHPHSLAVDFVPEDVAGVRAHGPSAVSVCIFRVYADGSVSHFAVVNRRVDEPRSLKIQPGAHFSCVKKNAGTSAE